MTSAVGAGTMKPEIILNLWYVYDEHGMIYKLLARAYVHTGTDDEKLAFLRGLAPTDYMLAQWFPLPDRFHTTIHEGSETRKMAVASIDALELSVGIQNIFEDAYQQIEKDLPEWTKLRIGKGPLVCITPLFVDENNELHPKTDKRKKL